MEFGGCDYVVCPICCERLNETELGTVLCPECEFQMCAFCVDQFLEKESPTCPSCRRPFSRANFRYSAQKAAEWHSQLAGSASGDTGSSHGSSRRDRGGRDRGRRSCPVPAHLQNAKILLPSSVTVSNFPEELARDERALRNSHFFGQYGQVSSLQVTGRGSGRGLVSVTVSYRSAEDAVVAIQATHAVRLGRPGAPPLSSALAFSRYCPTFLSGRTCAGGDCTKLHRYSPDHSEYSRAARVPIPLHRETYAERRPNPLRLPPPVNMQPRASATGPASAPAPAPWAKKEPSASPATHVPARAHTPPTAAHAAAPGSSESTGRRARAKSATPKPQPEAAAVAKSTPAPAPLTSDHSATSTASGKHAEETPAPKALPVLSSTHLVINELLGAYFDDPATAQSFGRAAALSAWQLALAC